MVEEYLIAVGSSPVGLLIAFIVGFIIFYGTVYIGVKIFRWIEFLVTGYM